MSLVKNQYVYGKYKIYAFKDENTNDYYVKPSGEYLELEENEDLYLKCGRPQKDSYIFYYGTDTFKNTKEDVLLAVITSNPIAEEVLGILGDSVAFHLEGDKEHSIYFYAKDIDSIKKTLKIVTKGALVLPYKDGVRRRKPKAKKQYRK